VFVNQNDKVLQELSKDIERINYGNSDFQLLSSSPSVQLKWKKKLITSQLYGKYNYNNILTAICIGNYFRVPENQIVQAIESYIPSNNRSQIIKIDSNIIYLDAYNANPTSMTAAIDTFAENTAPNKLMILGDMLELGKISQKEHQKIVDKVQKFNLTTIFVGEAFPFLKNTNSFISKIITK